MLRTFLDWLHRHPLVGDGALVAVLLPLAFGQVTSVPHERGPGIQFLGFLWGLAYVVPLLLRRRHPEVMGLLLVVAHVIQLIVVHEPTPGNFVLPFVFYALAAYAPRRRRWWWLVGGLVASVAAAYSWASNPRYDSPSAWVFVFTAYLISCLGAVGVSWFMGALARASRANVEALRQRTAALEGEKEQSARLAVAEERARIAREMHDVVAHSLSLIVVQTDGAAYVAAIDGDPCQQLATTRAALETIGGTARHALAETRRLVGVLQDQPADFAPQASLADIPALVQGVREAGFAATLQIRGDAPPGRTPEPPPLDQAAQMAAYRIVQESLTNVMKHAGPGADALVVLTYAAAGIDILVSDDGVGPTAPDGLGHGLIGMRERAQSVGGTFDAHPNPQGGFTVHATIPTTTGEHS